MYYRIYSWHVQAQGEGQERLILADCDRAEKQIRRDLNYIKSAGSRASGTFATIKLSWENKDQFEKVVYASGLEHS